MWHQHLYSFTGKKPTEQGSKVDSTRKCPWAALAMALPSSMWGTVFAVPLCLYLNKKVVKNISVYIFFPQVEWFPSTRGKTIGKISFRCL